MDTLELIKQRHSVRRYLEKPIDAGTMAIINAEIARLNSESGLHMQFMNEVDGVFGSLASRVIGWKSVPSYVALVGKDSPELEETCGYYGEQLVLFLQSIGLNTCWVGMFKAENVTAELREGERVVITIVVGYGANEGKPHKSKTVSDVTDVKDMSDSFRAGVECALLAPTAVNQQRFFFTIENGKPVAIAKGKGHFVNVDLGIVKYHFEVGSGMKF